MPALDNARHEQFAQNLALGMTGDEAYKSAGFKANRGNAARLKANEFIMKRVREIQDAALEELTKSADVDRAWLLKQLVKSTQDYEEASPPARMKALELIGKMLGVFTEKVEVDQTTRVVSADPMTPDQWVAQFGGQSEDRTVN